MLPQDFFNMQLRLTTLMVEAQSVMTLRILGMSGIIATPQGENSRMMQEKGPALAQSVAHASQALAAGQRPDQLFDAALAPVSDRVRSNRKRLMK
ncbi:MAG: antifreeze protein [Sulfitobacter sp.]